MDCSLKDRHCLACSGKAKRLNSEKIITYLAQLKKGWQINDNMHLEKEFAFDDFATALAFVNKIGAIAEEYGHHPELVLGWGKVSVALWTHKIGGLTESDFIVAANIDDIKGTHI